MRKKATKKITAKMASYLAPLPPYFKTAFLTSPAKFFSPVSPALVRIRIVLSMVGVHVALAAKRTIEVALIRFKASVANPPRTYFSTTS